MDSAEAFGVDYSDSAAANDGQEDQYGNAEAGFGQGGQQTYTDGQNHAEVQKEGSCMFGTEAACKQLDSVGRDRQGGQREGAERETYRELAADLGQYRGQHIAEHIDREVHR